MGEHFVVAADPDYSRFRQRINSDFGKNQEYFVNGELLTQEGAFSETRWTAGRHFQLGRGAAVDISYMYNPRRARFGETRHAIITTFHFGPVGRYRGVDD